MYLSCRFAVVAAAWLTVFSLGAGAAFAQDSPAAKLSKRIRFTVQAEIIPAYRTGNGAVVVSKLSPLLARMSLDDRIVLDDWFEQQGLPIASKMLTEIRLNFIRFGAPKGVPTPRGRELRLVLGELNDRLNATMSLRDSHAAMADPLPTLSTFEDYETLFWSVHVLQNQLLNAQRLAQAAVLLSRDAREMDLDGMPDFTARVDEVRAFSNSLAERQLELRLKRLQFAERTIGSSKELKQRILAAYAADLDSEVLLAFFKQPKGVEGTPAPTRAALLAEGLETQVRETRQAVATEAGALTAKSRLFFEGLHWWFRGRYGMGAEQGGLMKSRQAIQSQQTLNALSMPMRPPNPQDPTLGGQERTPLFDRRHHYIWATDQPRLITTTTYFH